MMRWVALGRGGRLCGAAGVPLGGRDLSGTPDTGRVWMPVAVSR